MGKRMVALNFLLLFITFILPLRFSFWPLIPKGRFLNGFFARLILPKRREDMILQAKNISKRYGNHLVVNHIHLQFEKGTFNAIIGPNGAGKSTTEK